MKKILKAIIGSLCACAISGGVIPVYAAGQSVTEQPRADPDDDNSEATTTIISPGQDLTSNLHSIIDRDTGTLTIRYFDDNEEQVPAAGAEFEVVQIATYGRSFTDNGKINYLDSSFEVDNGSEPDAFQYEKNVLNVYQQKPELGTRKETTIGSNGTSTITLPVGSYLVRETKTIRYHKRSKPFVVSVPEMNEDSNSWNFDVVANPKQILAGDLEVTKKAVGREASRGRTYTFKLTLDDGYTYDATMPDGSRGKLKNGDLVKIKSGQKLKVYDIPSGSRYSVHELEENTAEYKTSYKNCNSNILAKKAQKATVINDSSQYDMGVMSYPMLWMVIGAGAIVLIIVIVSTKNREDSCQN